MELSANHFNTTEILIYSNIWNERQQFAVWRAWFVVLLVLFNQGPEFTIFRRIIQIVTIQPLFVLALKFNREWANRTFSIIKDNRMASLEEVLCRSRPTCSSAEIFHASDCIFLQRDRCASTCNKHDLFFFGIAEVTVISLKIFQLLKICFQLLREILFVGEFVLNLLDWDVI